MQVTFDLVFADPGSVYRGGLLLRGTEGREGNSRQSQGMSRINTGLCSAGLRRMGVTDAAALVGPFKI